jgi:hypothetical protein
MIHGSQDVKPSAKVFLEPKKPINWRLTIEPCICRATLVIAPYSIHRTQFGLRPVVSMYCLVEKPTADPPKTQLNGIPKIGSVKGPWTKHHGSFGIRSYMYGVWSTIILPFSLLVNRGSGVSFRAARTAQQSCNIGEFLNFGPKYGVWGF